MFPFLATLNDEWAEMATSSTARRRLVRWATAYPVLAGCRDLFDILRRRSERPDDAPAVLAAFGGLAPNDELAARALLHALMPGLVQAARRVAHEDSWALEEMVALAWERIRTYPTTRHGSVAANVLWDVHKRYRQHRDIEQPKSEQLRSGGETMPSAEEVALNSRR